MVIADKIDVLNVGAVIETANSYEVKTIYEEL